MAILVALLNIEADEYKLIGIAKSFSCSLSLLLWHLTSCLLLLLLAILVFSLIVPIVIVVIVDTTIDLC
jgi:hypothetical protein